MRTKNEVLAFTPIYTFSATTTKNIQKSKPCHKFNQAKFNDTTLNLNRFINIKTIEALENLEENRNGYGTHSFDKKSIQRFLSIIIFSNDYAK